MSGVPRQVNGETHRALSLIMVEILRLIAAGAKYKDITEVRGTSPSTIRTQVSDIYRRLGADNAAHAVSLGYERGLLKVGGGA